MLIRKPKVATLQNKNKDKIKEVIKKMPATPGIYFMKNYKNKIIYIGKSKHLKNRVMSYFYNLDNRSNKIEKMISQINHIEIKLTETELDALILECRYIKKIKPPYNTLLKSPQKYCYIQLLNYDYPMLKISDNKEEDSIYFGPYFSKNMAQSIIQYINNTYRVRFCNKKYSKTNSKCLQYDLKKCVGACSIQYNGKEINEKINQISKLLNGDVEKDIENATNKMLNFSMNLEFEKANEYKNLIEALKYINTNQKLINEAMKLKNIIAYEEIDESYIKIFFIKGNKLLFSEKIKKNSILEKEFIKDLYNKTNEYFFDYKKGPKYIEKEDLDEINIVYSYLKKNDLPYLEIDDELLIKPKELKQRLKQFIKGC